MNENEVLRFQFGKSPGIDGGRESLESLANAQEDHFDIDVLHRDAEVVEQNNNSFGFGHNNSYVKINS